MKGHRIFDRFGFNLPKSSKEGKTTLLTDFLELHFDAKAADWVNPETGVKLTGFLAEAKLLAILENHINKDLE